MISSHPCLQWMISLPMYKIFVSKHFKNQLKPLVKKDRDLKGLLIGSLKGFNQRNAISVGSGIFKIRLQKRGMGKSGGYRLYVFVVEVSNILTPICIYSKTDRKNMTKGELAAHTEIVKMELESLL